MYTKIKRLGIMNLRYSGRQEVQKNYIGFSQKFTDKRLVDQFTASYRTLYKQGVIQEIIGRYGMEPAALE